MSELNLVPYEIKKNGKPLLGPSLNSGSKKYLTIGLIALVIVGIVIPIFRLESLRIKETSMKNEIKNGQKVLNESQKLANYIQNCKNHIATVQDISKVDHIVVQTIRKLEKHIVGDVILKSLDYAEGSIEIKAKARDYNSICIFAANVQESDEFKSARISTINIQQDGSYECSISINYQEVGKVE